MRIIAGHAGGIPLQVPRSLTRPTTDRVREAVFSSLMARIEGAAVLDLYAGSGALGLEALSRGAARATLVEQDRLACEVMHANLKKARLDSAEVVCQPVRVFLERRFGGRSTGEADLSNAGFDLIFADPPYARDGEAAAEIDALFSNPALAAALKPDGVLVFESLARTTLPLAQEEAPHWTLSRERRYGDTLVSFLHRSAES